MADASTLDTLCSDLFPAMRAASPGASTEAVRHRLVWLAGAEVARRRGLHLSDVPGEALPAAGGLAADALAALPDAALSIHLPGELYSRLLADRHGRGSYYTPPALAAQVATWTLDPLLTADAPIPAVLDPAMGSGHFLAAAGEAIAARRRVTRWQAAQHLYGVDSDPEAASLARLTLWLWAARPGTSPADFDQQLACADALLDDCLPIRFPARFGAVVGNPPYASVFTRVQNGDDQRETLKARYRTATGSFDLAVPFVERAVELAEAGGRVGLVVPNKLLAASYAGDLRAWLGEQTAVEVLADYVGASTFDADVYPVVLVLAKRSARPDDALTVYRANGKIGSVEVVRRGTQRDLRAPGGLWSTAFDPAWDVLRGCFDGAVPLGKAAELAAGMTVGEAYDLRERVVDAAPGMLPADALPLLTSGLLARHRSLWGRKEVRYLKRRFRRPVIMAPALPERRCQQARTQKLIVAGLGLRPQVVLERGMAQAAVSTTIITGSAWPLGALCALLNSALMARLYRALFGGLALGGGYLRFAQRELALLPLPDLPDGDPRLARLDALGRDISRADVLARADLDAQIDALVYALYGVDEAALS